MSDPKPGWLTKMEKSKKKIAWGAPKEAVNRLYELAEASATIPGKRAASFSKAAEQLAQIIGGEELLQLFDQWVEEQVRTATPS
jgi:hypothetical protein